jgi:hypothetical protein
MVSNAWRRLLAVALTSWHTDTLTGRMAFSIGYVEIMVNNPAAATM